MREGRLQFVLAAQNHHTVPVHCPPTGPSQNVPALLVP